MTAMIDLIEQSRLSAAVEAEEMTLITTLNPKISIDGNQWCVLYGENLQDGVAGFGDTPRLAVYDFNKAWDRSTHPMTSTRHPRTGEANETA